jgi:hypothetical protein
MNLPASIVAAVVGVLLAVGSSAAHEVKAGPHGGRVVEAGDHHVELVMKNNMVDVFLTDHNDKAVPASGYKGIVIVAIDGKSQRIVLAPVDSTRLSGQAAGAMPAQPKGVVQITQPNGKTVQAKFE